MLCINAATRNQHHAVEGKPVVGIYAALNVYCSDC